MMKLRDGLLPFAEPARSPWGLLRSKLQFVSQQNQIVGDVDVIEGFREACREFKGLRARQQSVKRTPGSHTVAFEERRVSRFGAYQIVATIMGWAHNHVMGGECFERALKNQWREVWTVAVECDDALPPGGSEMSKNRGEPSCKAFACLRHDLHCIAQ